MILYLPGTGGIFLRRVLSMNRHSIVSSVDQHVDLQQKFELFNVWDSSNWKPKEILHRPLYRTGHEEFYKFEESDQWLIDAWHPGEFIDHEQTGQCWIPGVWPGFVFITVNDKHRTFIEQQQKNKSYDLDWDWEQLNFSKAQQMYSDRAVEINFDCFFDCDNFLNQVTVIDKHFQLELDLTLVKLMWENWYRHSVQVWKIK